MLCQKVIFMIKGDQNCHISDMINIEKKRKIVTSGFKPHPAYGLSVEMSPFVYIGAASFQTTDFWQVYQDVIGRAVK